MVALIDREYLRDATDTVPVRMLSYALFEGRPLTTRGRSINGLVRNCIRLSSLAPVEVDAPIYIAGLGRSGTTALGRVLSVHPDVGYLNEPKLMWNLVHPAEDVIGSYSRDEASYCLGDSDATAEVIRRAHSMFGGYLRVVGRRRLVDKYPEIVFRTDFIRSVFSDARFLCLVRSAADAISSIVEWSHRHGCNANGERHDWWGANDRKWKILCRDVLLRDPIFEPIHPLLPDLARHEDRAALEWVATTRYALHAKRRHPRNTLLIRYENWTNAPRSVTARMLAWVGLAEDDRTLDFAERTLCPPLPRRRVKIRREIQYLVDAAHGDLESVGWPTCA